MEWLSQNWVYVLLLLGVVFLMTRGGMGCGMGSHHSRSRHDHGGGAGPDGTSTRAGPSDPVSSRAVDPQTAVSPDGKGEKAHQHRGGCC